MVSRNYTCRQLAGYAASILLVPVYVNLFDLWSALSNRVDARVLAAAPIAVTVVIIALLLLAHTSRKNPDSTPGCRRPLLVGAALCLAALALPDPRFPVKRIHVAEYLLISLVVRYAMSFRLQGRDLLFFSACFSALLGIHDEFIQGLHPARTYGLRDMLVNAVSACGGALVWQAFGLFERRPFIPVNPTSPATTLIYLLCLFGAVAALIVPAAFYRTSWLPVWIAMPLLGTAVQFSLYESRFCQRRKHGVVALSGIAFSLIFYPVFNHVAKIAFY